MKKHVTVLVSNDLEHDQRVAKVCSTLLGMGYEITLVGRMLPGSKPMQRPYETRRFHLLFHRGILFYIALHLRLFFYLLRKRTDLILANDLDTLLPAFIVSKLRNKKIVYDSHEYFTGAEGLTGRKFPTWAWTQIERYVFPRLRYVYTVNESIAKIYRELYHVPVLVVRNVPPLVDPPMLMSRAELGLPPDKKILLLQGAYIDPDRGAVEALRAMEFVDNALLVIIGSGRSIPEIKKMAESPIYSGKILLLDKMPFAQLSQYTRNADLGLSLDQPVHLNYKFSLPNKLFDYIHAGIPILASDLPEIRRVFEKYSIGNIVKSIQPKELATAMHEALTSAMRDEWKIQLKRARLENNWQQEEKILVNLFSEVLPD